MSELEPEDLNRLKAAKRGLRDGTLDGTEAGELMQQGMSFAFDSRELDAPITEILDKASLGKRGRLEVDFPLDATNSEVEADIRGGSLRLTVSVNVPITLRDGVCPDDASRWLDENNGRFAPYVRPYRFSDDQDCRAEIVQRPVRD